MATSDTFRALLIGVLQNPKDTARGLVLADWLQEQDHPRADVIRQSFHNKVAYLTKSLQHMVSAGGKEAPVADIVVQLIPQSLAIEFGCRCAEAVIDSVEEIFPGDETVTNVLQAIRSWISGKGTKRAVALAQEGLTELNEEMAGEGDSDLDDAEERDSIGKALCVVQAINLTAAAVQFPATSEKWWACISGSLIEAGYGSDQKSRAWQHRILIPFIREQDLGL